MVCEILERNLVRIQLRIANSKNGSWPGWEPRSVSGRPFHKIIFSRVHQKLLNLAQGANG